MAFVIVWSFRVPAARRTEFERHYGPHGSWAALFQRGAGHLGTDLLRDREDGGRFVTIDRWETAEAWRAFRERFANEYEALDRRCEGLASEETRLGEFETA